MPLICISASSVRMAISLTERATAWRPSPGPISHTYATPQGCTPNVICADTIRHTCSGRALAA